MKKKYLIQVAPLVRLPILGTQVFSYLSERALPVGTLVNVPFYRRVLKGIVVSAKEDFPRSGGMRLKNVTSVVEEGYLSEWQIELAEKLARRYFAPLGTFLGSMTPEIKSPPKADQSRAEKIKNQKSKIRKTGRLRKVPAVTETKSILESKKNKTLVIGRAKERFVLDIGLISRTVKRGKQSLIIIPEIFMAFEMSEMLREYFPKESIALVHGKLSKKDFFGSWKKIKEGRVKIIVATKVGVFLPFADLGLVIVEEEGDVSHKQWDMSPRYNAARAAEILADTHGAKLVFGSAYPAIDTFWRASAAKWQTLELKDGAGKAETEVVDLFGERKKPDFPISKTLYENVARTLDKKGKIILLAKRRGYSTFSVCRSCKSVLKCPECDRALVYFEELSGFRCPHCTYRADLFSSCPKCGGFQFSHSGAGTQLVERKIKRLFPEAKTFRFDADSVKTVKKYDDFRRKIKEGKIDIVIGTQMALKLGGFHEFDLVGVISAQDLAGFADFNSTELAMSRLAQAGNLAGHDGKLVLQAFSGQDRLLNDFVSRSYDNFFEKEIKLRNKLFYPPFGRIIKLTCRERDKKKLEKEAGRVFDLLLSSGNNEKEVQITEPYDPLAAKKRGFFLKLILIKTAAGKDPAKMPFYPILAALKKGWAVDADPISTI